MVDREMVELNKLIAMFMGAIPNGKHPDVYGLLKTKENTKPYQVCWVSLRYDTSWDWLMPVVKRINKLEPKQGFPKESDGWIAFYGMEPFLLEANREGVHRNIIEFIKWYNEQKDDK